MKTHKRLAVAMTIAGSDNSGGAGIEADLKTFTTLGVYGVCAITCVVAEHPGKVKSIQAIRPRILVDQIALNFEAFPIRAVKTGMLFSTELIRVVVKQLRKQRKRGALVVDPVMVATSGGRLLQSNAIKILVEELIPMATLITPNLDEASLLLGERIKDLADAKEAAVVLQRRFGCQVLLKGGHLNLDQAIDLLANKKRLKIFRSVFRKNIHTHGTGCTLSAAITANLAQGVDMETAVAKGKQFINRAIDRALRLGRFDVLNHLN